MTKLALLIAAAATSLALLPTATVGAPLGPPCPSKVMAFYYTWYGGPPAWRHWAAATGDPRFAHDPNRVIARGRQYPEGVRRDIASTDYPSLGPYDSPDTRLIDHHLAVAREAGIDVLISSWWGPGTYEDHGLRRLLDRVEATRSPIRVAVYLETWALFYGGQLQPGFVLDPRNFSPDSRAQIRAKAAQWIAYLIRNYGQRSGFYRAAKGSAQAPVIFFYFAGLFEPPEWQDIFAQAQALAGTAGFYQGDIEGADPQGQTSVFDGIHVYTLAPFSAEGDLSLAARVLDPNAAVHLPGSEVFDQGTVGGDYAAWSAAARGLGRSWAATVIPGFDDRRVRSPSFVVSRDRGAQRTYDFYWDQGLASRPDWVLITSFNEWHEGTEIEPSVEYGDEFVKRTRAWANRVHRCSPPGPDRSPPAIPRHGESLSIRLTVTPRTVLAGARRRFRFRATAISGGRRGPVAGATIRFAGTTIRTDVRGRASVVKRLRSAGRYRARASRPGMSSATARVRVVRSGGRWSHGSAAK
jgi:hypothetical protein